MITYYWYDKLTSYWMKTQRTIANRRWYAPKTTINQIGLNSHTQTCKFFFISKTAIGASFSYDSVGTKCNSAYNLVYRKSWWYRGARVYANRNGCYVRFRTIEIIRFDRKTWKRLPTPFYYINWNAVINDKLGSFYDR